MPTDQSARRNDLGSSDQRVLNVPNILSFARLTMAMVVGLLIEWQLFLLAAILFIVAASTDFIDGWWARRYGQITKLGRVLDPFVDKVIVTAAMVALVGFPNSGIVAWMVTVIVGRELLVTSLRAMVEGQGGDFSARSLGKWKMLLQCAAIVASLLQLTFGSSQLWIKPTTTILVWAALLITIASGIDYVAKIVQINRSTTA
jgi:CDP-diacylglycerol---glycerol-3-phosphate 3-phosphatidyltransferase